MIYREEKCDLFSVSGNYYFVQCISADFGMGKGIAVEFNKYFDMKNKLINKYKTVDYETVGSVVFVENIPVFNLVTKSRYWNKPTYRSLTKALIWLRDMVEERNIKKLAMPKIGCGLDGLKWDTVSEIIKNIFDDTDIEILVCYI